MTAQIVILSETYDRQIVILSETYDRQIVILSEAKDLITTWDQRAEEILRYTQDDWKKARSVSGL